jgi:hypothetical protein
MISKHLKPQFYRNRPSRSLHSGFVWGISYVERTSFCEIVLTKFEILQSYSIHGAHARCRICLLGRIQQASLSDRIGIGT